MNATKPWIVGAAFAVTIAFLNIACTIAVVLAPDATFALFNSWAHGIDLALIRRDAANPLTFYSWGAGFATAVIGGFVVGAIYGWARILFIRVDRAIFSGRPHAVSGK